MSGKRMAVAGAVAIGAAVALAGPAGAEPVSGDYTFTVTEAEGKNGYPPAFEVGEQGHWTVVPCGPECLNIRGEEFHLVDNAWTGSFGAGLTDTIDSKFSVWTDDAKYWTVKARITKDG